MKRSKELLCFVTLLLIAPRSRHGGKKILEFILGIIFRNWKWVNAMCPRESAQSGRSRWQYACHSTTPPITLTSCGNKQTRFHFLSKIRDCPQLKPVRRTIRRLFPRKIFLGFPRYNVTLYRLSKTGLETLKHLVGWRSVVKKENPASGVVYIAESKNKKNILRSRRLQGIHTREPQSRSPYGACGAGNASLVA